MSFLLLAFDFKGEESGGLYQVVSFVAAISLLALAAGLISFRRSRYPSRRSQVVLLLLALYLVSTAITALVQQVPWQNYAVLVSNYLLFAVSFWFAYGILRRYGLAPVGDVLIPALKVMVGISLAWTMIYGLNGAGVSILDARYRVVGVLIPLAFVWIVAAFSGGKFGRADAAMSALVLLVLVVSQTRVYLLVFAAAMVLGTYASSNSSSDWAKRVLKITAGGGVLVALAVSVADIFSVGADGRGFIDLWGARLFASESEFGFDITTATRLAEYSDQVTKLTSTPANALIGLGLGAPYSYSGKYAQMVVSALGSDALRMDYWNGGHSLFVYTIYASGVVFGSIFIGLIISGVWVSWENLREARRAPVGRFPFIFFSAGFICFVITGLTAFPLGYRPVSMVMGITFAVLLAQRRFLSRVRASCETSS